MGLCTTPAQDLLNGLHVYVEVRPEERQEEHQPHAIVRDSDYIADSGTDCPVCGSCDCMKDLPQEEMGLSCTECKTVWYQAYLDNLEE
jgi:hypothetical protein